MDVIKKSLAYMTSSKKRLLKILLYGFYLYLFSKRFVFVLRYFKNSTKSLIKYWFSTIFGRTDQKGAKVPLKRTLLR